MTLVGAGGCGKTRLATEFALGRLRDYADGVWFAAFDTLTGGDGVPAAVAEAVGLSSADTAGQPAWAAAGIVERLHNLLADRTALVILDNCEHVIDDAARLAVDLLASAPRLQLLATSREALRVPGEMVWRVPPLNADEAVRCSRSEHAPRSPTSSWASVIAPSSLRCASGWTACRWPSS